MQVLGSDLKYSNDWLNLEAQGQYRWAIHKVLFLQAGKIKDERSECWDQFLHVKVMNPLLTLQEQTNENIPTPLSEEGLNLEKNLAPLA